MSEPTIIIATSGLLPGTVPAALLFLSMAFLNAANPGPLQSGCRLIFPAPPSAVPVYARILIGSQSFLGVMLLIAPSWILAGIGLFSFLLCRGLVSRRRSGFPKISLHLGLGSLWPGPVALFLDSVLLLSLLDTVVRTAAAPITLPPSVGVIGAVLVTAASLLITSRSLQGGSLLRRGAPHPGAPWPAAIGGPLPVQDPTVVLMIPSDGHDGQSWLRLLRARAALGSFYPLHILTAGTDIPLSEKETLITLPPDRFLALSDRFPCALLVSGGVVVARWTEELPAEWLIPRSAKSGHEGSPESPPSESLPRNTTENHRYFSAGPV